jgi:hypothetical protein
MRDRPLRDLLDAWARAREQDWRADMSDDEFRRRIEQEEARATMQAVVAEIERRIGGARP